MAYRYAVMGAGRQGISSAYDLGRFGSADDIMIMDIDEEAARHGAERINQLLSNNIARSVCVDASDLPSVKKHLQGVHSTVSAVPYFFNLELTQVAIEVGSNFCDLGGNTQIVRDQLKLNNPAKEANISITPDCGLGPGLNVSMAVHAMDFLDQPEEVFIWDGGLPQNPIPPWNYQLTFHINGLTNEYFGDAFFLRNWKVSPIPGLTELETLSFPDPLGQLEAAVTTGGLSTAPWTFEGKLKTLENKTLRYPGHWKTFQAYKELGLFEEKPIPVNGQDVAPRDLFHTLLEPKIRAERIRDICIIRVECRGLKDNNPAVCTLDLIETYDETTGFTAMEKLTGWHASIIAILGAKGQLPKGAVPVELALPGHLLQNEANLRNWQIKNQFSWH